MNSRPNSSLIWRFVDIRSLDRKHLGPVANLFQQVAYPRLSKMCPVIMRAGGVLLIKDAAHLKEEFKQQSGFRNRFLL